MKTNSLETRLSLNGFSAQDSVSRSAALAKEVFVGTHIYRDEEDKISCWQLVFSQSKANGCSYRGEDLPHMKWRWPRHTWFQEQLSHHVKAGECAAREAKN